MGNYERVMREAVLLLDKISSNRIHIENAKEEARIISQALKEAIVAGPQKVY